MTTTTMSVAGLNELALGERKAFARGIHGRKAQDGVVTIYLRRKVDGKSIDTKITTLADISKKSVNEAIAAAEAQRGIKPEVKKARTLADVVAPGKLGARSTMQEVWEHWLADLERSKFWSPTNIVLNTRRVNAHCATWGCWDKPIADLGASDLTPPLLALRDSTPHTAKKILDLVTGIFRHAEMEHVRSDAHDPMPAVKKRFRHNFKAPPKKHFAALTDDINELRALVAAIRSASGDASVRNALFLQAMVVQRTGEIIAARWEWFKDLEGANPRMVIPRAAMKISDDIERGDQILPLAPQVAAWVKELPRHKSGYLFPGRGERAHVSSEALSKAMREGLGQRDKHVPHGWRSSLSTLAREAVKEDGGPMFAEAWIEGTLDHLSGSQIKDAYNRRGHHEGVARLLRWWADQLLA